MAKKNIGTGGGAGVDEAPAVAVSEWIVVTSGARLPNGVMMEIGETFTLASAGYSEAHVVNLLNERVIEPVLAKVTKPYSKEVVTKSAVSGGDAA